MKRAVVPPTGPTVKAQGFTGWAAGSESAPGQMTSWPLQQSVQSGHQGAAESHSTPHLELGRPGHQVPGQGLGTQTSHLRTGAGFLWCRPVRMHRLHLFACTDSVCPSCRTGSSPISPHRAGAFTVISLVRSRHTEPRGLFVLIRKTICIPAFPQ